MFKAAAVIKQQVIKSRFARKEFFKFSLKFKKWALRVALKSILQKKICEIYYFILKYIK